MTRSCVRRCSRCAEEGDGMSESLTERSGQGWALRTGVDCAAAI